MSGGNLKNKYVCYASRYDTDLVHRRIAFREQADDALDFFSGEPMFRVIESAFRKTSYIRSSDEWYWKYYKYRLILIVGLKKE